MHNSTQANLSPICRTPVMELEPNELDSRHPTMLFNLHWHGLASGQSPSWHQFQPMRVPSLLRWVMLFCLEVENHKNRFRLSIQGESAAHLTKGSCQGKYLDEFTFHECYFARQWMLIEALNAKTPQYGKLLSRPPNIERTMDLAIGAFPFPDAGRVIVISAPIRELDRLHL